MLSVTGLLHRHLKFVYTISFSYQPIQHRPSASEQKPSIVCCTFIELRQAFSTQTVLKINFKSLLEGIFFPAFQFSTSVVSSLLHHIQKCVQLIGTHSESQCQGSPPPLFSPGGCSGCVRCVACHSGVCLMRQ